jgi:lysophospholipase L1-like esterase
VGHVVLLGDSIFDNQVYVTPAPDVSRQLRARLGSGWTVTLLAVDGHVTADVRERQLERVPAAATHLVVSVGGNDALGYASILKQRATSVAEAVGYLADAQSRFATEYDRMIASVQRFGVSTGVCTIYDANYPEPQRRMAAHALVSMREVPLIG